MERKLAFVGTSCVGKTILLERMQERHSDQNYIFLEEQARKFFEANPMPEERRFSYGVQRQLQDKILHAEVAAHRQSPEAIICDRSVLDAPVYVFGNGDPDGAERLFKRAEHWLPSYYRIYLLNPRGVQFETDRVRQESKATRMHIHKQFLNFFALHNIQYELLSGTPEERLEIIEAVL